ncbi:hypothetical protein HYW43_01870 [Candidatus Daviesbacteria bacterium]|nr:hypothetical protein [Candidatus Daviesbacteria bacterium]
MTLEGEPLSFGAIQVVKSILDRAYFPTESARRKQVRQVVEAAAKGALCPYGGARPLREVLDFFPQADPQGQEEITMVVEYGEFIYPGQKD